MSVPKHRNRISNVEFHISCVAFDVKCYTCVGVHTYQWDSIAKGVYICNWICSAQSVSSNYQKKNSFSTGIDFPVDNSCHMKIVCALKKVKDASNEIYYPFQFGKRTHS